MNELDILVAEAEDVVRFLQSSGATAEAITRALRREDVRREITHSPVSTCIFSSMKGVWTLAARDAGYDIVLEDDYSHHSGRRTWIAILDLKEIA